MDQRSVARPLNNADVHWDGNFLGLYPQLKGSAKVAAQLPQEQTKPYLLEALEDTNRFVVAHVLLSSMVSAASGTNAETWNGLKVNINAEGQAIIPMEQRSDIQRKWIKGP
ncbi:MAG: hypothetical protein JWN25_298 [Verrucomicrobiales bacterium]|nr:hypothetical protein [Verrucomicrobiales bacterium]